MPSLAEIGPVVLEKKIFLIVSMYFHYFIIISPLKRAWPFMDMWTNLNPLHPRINCARFDWNWQRFFNLVNVFSLWCNYFPLGKRETLLLKKLESTSTKDALCQVWFKWAQWFWRRRFLNFVNVFSLFRYHLPLEKGGAIHLNKLESPLPKKALCQV